MSTTHESSPIVHTDDLYIAQYGERVTVIEREGDYLTCTTFGDSCYDGQQGRWIGGYHIGVCNGRTSDTDHEDGTVWGSPFGSAYWSQTDYVGQYDDWKIRESVLRAVTLANRHGVDVAVPDGQWYDESDA